jgi:NADH-quinone oxidoreductase subunit L
VLEYAWLIPVCPFLAFVLIGLIPKKALWWEDGGAYAIGGALGAFLLSMVVIWEVLNGHTLTDDSVEFTWLIIGDVEVRFGLWVDQLTAVMLLVISVVGTLVVFYSGGYMHEEGEGRRRYYAEIMLFISVMYGLVIANNYLEMFVFWELVGLCSYLLIGFWYEKKFTGDAAKKAFVVNRIGDVGFLLGMFLMFERFGSLRFDAVFAQAGVLSPGSSTLFWITLLLFLGAIGKSAQIPLHVWLPDAMAGPTPVSALIHAATMVTAGVYMVARSSILYALSPATLEIVAVVGAVTAVFAASIGLVQNDIKKVLAYSTVSQLGYMFLAMGVAGFAAGMFHLVTHAFFKGLLFLGSGAVIHAMHEEQDIQNMGGLRKHLPVTHWTFVAGAVAIAGIPPFSGFFSKDEILWKAFSSDYGSVVLWLLGVVGAAMTAFYMFRLVNLTFYGEPRYSESLHPHEAPKSMTIPLVILAVLSAVGGFIGVPSSLGGGNAIEHWLEPVFARAQDKLRLGAHAVETTEYLLMALSVAVALGGIYLAYLLYLRRREWVGELRERFPRTYRVLLNKYYVDEAYDAAVVRPTVSLSESLLWRGFDVAVIDGLVNGSARLAGWLAQLIRRVQTGVVQHYALVFFFGILVILTWMVFA